MMTSPLYKGLGLPSGMGINGDPGPTGRIPLPDYKDPKSRNAYAEAWTKKYGPLMQGRGDTPLRINEIPAWGKMTAKNMSIDVAKRYGIDPALLYSSAMEEGMSGLFPHTIEGREKEGLLVDYSNNPQYPTEGSHSFGMDNFVSQFPEFVKRGYLPAEFKDRFIPVKFEPGYTQNSALYKSPEDAMLAKGAYLKYFYDDIDEYAKKIGVQLTPKARDFFALASYNAGPGGGPKSGQGGGHQMLDEYLAAGYLKGDAFLKKRPTSGPALKADSWKVPYMNTMRRIKMAEALRNEGHFDDQLPQQMAAPITTKRK